MLYIFHGDPKTVIEKVEGTIASLLGKNTDATVVRAEDEMVVGGGLGDILFEQGLFKSTYIVYINALSSELSRDYIFENLETLKKSPHLILLGLAAVKEKELKELEVAATKIQKCTEVQPPYIRVSGGVKRDPFKISDALLSNDKRALFVELEHARLGGERGEEVVGVLFWAAKTMVLAASAKTATEAGLKDYPFRKAQAGLKAWGADGAEKLLVTLAHVPTNAYRNGEDVFSALERELCG
jgi:hypothetical protein